MQKILSRNNSCPQKDSSENDSYVGVQTFMWMTENNLVEVSFTKEDLLERILSPSNLNIAYKRIVQNRGSGGVDDLGTEDLLPYLTAHKNELIASLFDGSYRPNPVRRVEIPKENGTKRQLGIPTVVDRLIQQAISQVLSPLYEREFSDNSYGFRPKRGAHQALRKSQSYITAGYKYVVDLDLEKFFDTVPQIKLMEILSRRIKDGRVLSLIHKYMRAGVVVKHKFSDSKQGVPQGGVISPVLANLFLHYAFDSFMAKEYPKAWWERYADDGVLHCKSYQQAMYMKSVLRERFRLFGLELNEEKTRIVYCKDADRTEEHSEISFDFLGYTFRPRLAKNKHGNIFLNFLPAMSTKAIKALKEEVRSWRLQLKVWKSLNDLANIFNSQIQGWISYYGHFYKSELIYSLRYINQCLIKWVRRKYKKLSHRRRAEYWLGRIAQRDKNLFAHWRYGVLPTAG